MDTTMTDGQRLERQRLKAWLDGGLRRTHEETEAGHHELRDHGILVASHHDLGVAVDIAERR